MSAAPYDIEESISARLPPHSLEAEQSVLGGLLLDNSAFDRISDILTEEDFYQGDHRVIFRHIIRALERQQSADMLTIDESIKNSKDAGEIGLAYLGQLAQSTPSSHNIRRYAEIVRERAQLRRIVVAGNEMIDMAMNPRGREAGDIMDECGAKVLSIGESRAGSEFQGMETLLTQTMQKLDDLASNPNRGAIIGLPTGFHDIDHETSGLQDGDLIIVAGRPSMGKTAFALNIAEHVAVDQRLPVAVFSMEMPGQQLALRLLGSNAKIDLHRLRTANMHDEEWQRVSKAIAKMHDAPLMVDETGALSPLDLRSRARRLYRKLGKLGLIVVDYLQLMQAGRSGENRATEISEISRSLKALAKELSVPVIALSQLNRSLEQRPNKRPIMSDLRESGAIEQDADLILFIYRDEVYNAESAERGKAEIIIAKQRNGPIGTVNLTWLGHLARFENYAKLGGM